MMDKRITDKYYISIPNKNNFLRTEHVSQKILGQGLNQIDSRSYYDADSVINTLNAIIYHLKQSKNNRIHKM